VHRVLAAMFAEFLQFQSLFNHLLILA